MLALTLLACLCLLWAQSDQAGGPAAVGRVPLAAAGWTGEDLPRLDATVLQYLKPDSYIWREYRRGGDAVNFTVLYGRRKSTFHSPGFCLLSEGWNVTQRDTVIVPVGSRSLLFNKMVLERHGQTLVAMYAFLYGNRHTPSWAKHQWRLMMGRITRRQDMGALVRLIVPVIHSEAQAMQTGREFLSTFYPYVPVRRI